MWRRSFGGSPDVVGRQIDLDGKAFTIVGVAPADFLSETVGESVDVWATMALMPPALRTSPGYTWLNLMGRLKPGVSVATGQAQIDAIAPSCQIQRGHHGRDRSKRCEPRCKRINETPSFLIEHRRLLLPKLAN